MTLKAVRAVVLIHSRVGYVLAQGEGLPEMQIDIRGSFALLCGYTRCGISLVATRNGRFDELSSN